MTAVWNGADTEHEFSEAELLALEREHLPEEGDWEPVDDRELELEDELSVDDLPPLRFVHTEHADRNTGEALPPLADFTVYEVGAFDNAAPLGFRRYTLVHDRHEMARWRMRYDNTGVFRTMLYSNNPNYIEEFSDPETLSLGDLCFDMDAPKDLPDDVWSRLITEVEEVLTPRLCFDFGIPRECIRYWFSGGRGMHVEIPHGAIGVWAHHDLHRIYNFYARRIMAELKLEFLDLSLYGAKHLYRLEHSRHQRTGLFKFPLQFRELAAVRASFAIMQRFAAAPRADALTDLYTTVKPTPKGLHYYALLAREALVLSRVVPPAPVGMRTRANYDPGRFLCVTELFSPGYTIATGARHAMLLYLCSHYRDAGFSYDQALTKIMEYANDHCDPPLTGKNDLADIERYLTKQFEATQSAGCTYVQNNFPSLCHESECAVGKSRLANRQKRTT